VTKGTRHILAATALVTLSACTSGYVSGYDEIRQRQAAEQAQKTQPPARAASQTRPAEPAKSARTGTSAKTGTSARTGTSAKTGKSAKTGTSAKKTGTSATAAKSASAAKTGSTTSTGSATSGASGTARAASASAAPPVAQTNVHTVGGGTVTVQRGETLFAISRRTGVELRDLIVANNLEPPYTLQAGQTLTIPAARYHVVRPGETGYSISRAYGTDLTTLARLNNLEKPYAVRVGQRLRLPASPTLGTGEAPRQLAARPAGSTASAAPAASSAQTPQAAQAKPATQTAAAAPKPLPEPAAFSGTFTWPLTGRLLSTFGPKQGGLHNDGINIAATQGATVRAAAPGVVAYADNGLKGFGWLVLIKHGDGWVTAYAHNEAVLVKRGDTVRAGEPIARAGATGSVDRPQLHFEIRRGRRAVDPLKHLPPSPVS